MAAKFVNTYWSHYGSWTYDDWNKWRKNDGFLCRTNRDCNWLDDSFMVGGQHALSDDKFCTSSVRSRSWRQVWAGIGLVETLHPS